MAQDSFKQRLKGEIDSIRGEWDKSRNPSIRVHNSDRYVRLVFERLDLDIEKPEHQTLLLFALGRVLRGSRPLKPARFLNTLILDAEAIVKKHGPGGGKREAIQRLRLMVSTATNTRDTKRIHC